MKRERERDRIEITTNSTVNYLVQGCVLTSKSQRDCIKFLIKKLLLLLRAFVTDCGP